MARRSLGFTDVDQMAHPDYYIQYLDLVDGLEVVHRYKKKMLDFLTVRPEQHLLDIGCGTGTDARRLAALVGSTGHVVGIDKSQTMITESRRRARGLHLPLTFHLGDAENLAFPDQTFGGAWVDRVLQHLARPQQAVAELARITRPGARLVMGVPNFTTFIIEGEDTWLPALLIKIMSLGCHHSDIGERLPDLCRRSGLVNIRTETLTGQLTDYGIANTLLGIVAALKKAVLVGFVSFEEAKAWHYRQLTASEAGHFACTLTGTIVCAIKP